MISPEDALAEDALADCIRVLPAFGAYWEIEGGYRYEDGAFSVCGVYSILTWFLQEQWRSLTEDDWKAFADLASDLRRREGDPAHCFWGCLIENLEGQEFSPLVVQHFDPEILKEFGFAI